MRRLLLICFFIFFFAWAAWAQESTPSDQAEAEDEDAAGPEITPFLRDVLESDLPIVLEADRVEYDQQDDVYRASGNVVLSQQDATLSADTMMLDMAQGVLICDGMITLTTPQGRVTAQSLRVDIRRETAVMARALFIVYADDATYFIRGRRIEKIGPERYLIHNGSYTTCDCGAEEADWMVEAEYIDVTFDGYAVVENGRVYLQGLAVAYVPYGIFPAKIKRSTGFLWPETGWSEDDGYHIGLPFYWNLAPHTDATIDTDWYENRGVKMGLEHRYAISRRWQGETHVDLIEDQLTENQRWALAYEQTQNVWRRLYVRANANLVSDNEYVIDFPDDVSARYDRFLRSDFVVNNLWQNYDVNVLARHWDDLSVEDNSYTWQQYPLVRFDAVSQRFGALPVFGHLDAVAVNFYRPKISEEERAIDAAAGHNHPYYFTRQGQRVAVQPGIYSPLNFNQYLTVTPYALGYGTLYQTSDRLEDRTVSRATGELGANAFTRFERVFPTHAPVVKGLKHQIEPNVGYQYRPEVDQDELPIFDGYDRLGELSALSYGLTNRLWMRLFDLRGRRFHTIKLTDLRVIHGYDFAEDYRKLDVLDPGDERRPWMPWTFELETLATAGRWLNKILIRSDMDYDTYQDEVTRFNVLGVAGTVNEDALGAEYRYHVDRDGFIDIEFLSGIFRYTLQEFLTFEYITRYSFIDRYFIETIYAVEMHSLQNCWHFRLQVEHHEIPEPETVTKLLLDFTGLIQGATSY